MRVYGGTGRGTSARGDKEVEKKIFKFQSGSLGGKRREKNGY